MKLKVGVIGTGHLGRFHSLHYQSIPNAQLVGVMDLNRESAMKTAQETRSRMFESMDALLRSVDAVSIAVPTDRHLEVGMAAIQHGVHCLIEKPIARDEREANALVMGAKEKNLILHVGHTERFNPALRSLEGIPIQPRFIESHRLAPFNPRGTEVSVVLDLMIHDLDIVIHMAGSPVDRVDASGVAVVSDSIDIANARIRFKNGCVANITASRISQKKMRKLRIFQKDAYITVDFLERYSEYYKLGTSADVTEETVGEIGAGNRKRLVLYRRPAVPAGDALRMELEAFVQAVQGGPSSGVTGEEGKKALALAVQILKAVED